MTRTKQTKQVKPYPEFPLTIRDDGRLCKKIRGKIHYFGRIEDWETAIKAYREQIDDLKAGKKPRGKSTETTVGALLNRFLYAKKLQLESREISPRSYAEYERTCDQIILSIDAARPLSDLDETDFQKLRSDLGKGKLDKTTKKHRQLGLTTLKGNLTRARMVFNYANEHGLAQKPVCYRTTLKTPSRRLFRELDNERGERMFEPEQILAMIEKAEPQVKAMIYLGINCGFGNSDVGTLPKRALDLDNAWHHYARPKTGNKRRCPLWPETVQAIRDAMESMTKEKVNKGTRATAIESDYVFLTRHGECWCKHETGDNALSAEIRKLLQDLGIYRKNITTFYTLRRTFETIAITTGDQKPTDFIMGHCPEANDMSSIYQQKTYNQPLLKVSNHVRSWLLGEIQLA